MEEVQVKKQTSEMSQCERLKQAHTDSVDDNIMHLHVVSTCELCLDISLAIQNMASRGATPLVSKTSQIVFLLTKITLLLTLFVTSVNGFVVRSLSPLYFLSLLQFSMKFI